LNYLKSFLARRWNFWRFPI